MKKYLLSIFAIILAIGAMSFQSSTNASNTIYYWYDATGTLMDPNGSSTPPTGCEEVGDSICAYAHDRILGPEEDPFVGAIIEVKYP